MNVLVDEDQIELANSIQRIISRCLDNMVPIRNKQLAKKHKRVIKQERR